MKCPICKVNMLESVHLEPIIGAKKGYNKKTVCMCPVCGHRVISK